MQAVAWAFCLARPKGGQEHPGRDGDDGNN